MATSKAFSARPAYRFLSTDQIALPTPHDSAFEFDESDVYCQAGSSSTEFRRAAANISIDSKKAAKLTEPNSLAAPPSLPVNVPDWSKILRREYRGSRRRNNFEDDSEDGEDDVDGGGGEGMRVPPHELLARTRIASFSVHEGRGRTLKGRDLSRVRNAIWEKTGFED